MVRSQLLRESEGVHKALEAGTDYHSEGEGEDGHHKDPRRLDGEEGSRQSEHGVECAEYMHHGHNNPGGEKWESARGSGNGDCSHGEGVSYRSHQWQHNYGEENETGMVRGSGHRATGSVIE